MTKEYNQAIYIDTPFLGALKQIKPFFASGIFHKDETPLLLKDKKYVRIQETFTKESKNFNINWVKPFQIPHISLEKNSVVFYPYNSQSNMHLAANRNAKHVMVHHGESNKIASYRPASRLFDYISVAGPLAIDRYIQNGIFTSRDVDNGRLIKMGNSFIQEMSFISSAQVGDSDTSILYSPTWEGYNNGGENYSSVWEKHGFKMTAQSARIAKTRKIYIKPHPYLGLLRPKIILDFIAGLKLLQKQGLQVGILSADANFLLRSACKIYCPCIPFINEQQHMHIKVVMGLCDVSGMETIFLNQKINYMVLTQPKHTSSKLDTFYNLKLLNTSGNNEDKISDYLNIADVIDKKHRDYVIGWQDPILENMTGQERRIWLLNYVRTNDFWNNSTRG
jgi:hypothetical protein